MADGGLPICLEDEDEEVTIVKVRRSNGRNEGCVEGSTYRCRQCEVNVEMKYNGGVEGEMGDRSTVGAP